MRLTHLTPVLEVVSIEETIGFYRDVLGFDCVGEETGWARLRNGSVEIMISLPNAHIPFDKPHLTGSLYFNPEDVDALWEQIKEKTTVVYPLENFHYGMREFAIRDNNGYCLNFGTRIADPSQVPEKDED